MWFAKWGEARGLLGWYFNLNWFQMIMRASAHATHMPHSCKLHSVITFDPMWLQEVTRKREERSGYICHKRKQPYSAVDLRKGKRWPTPQMLGSGRQRHDAHHPYPGARVPLRVPRSYWASWHSRHLPWLKELAVLQYEAPGYSNSLKKRSPLAGLGGGVAFRR